MNSQKKRCQLLTSLEFDKLIFRTECTIKLRQFLLNCFGNNYPDLLSCYLMTFIEKIFSCENITFSARWFDPSQCVVALQFACVLDSQAYPIALISFFWCAQYHQLEVEQKMRPKACYGRHDSRRSTQPNSGRHFESLKRVS